MHGIRLTCDGLSTSNKPFARLRSNEIPPPFFPHRGTSSEIEVRSTLLESDAARLEEGWTRCAIASHNQKLSGAKIGPTFDEKDAYLYVVATFRVPCLTVEVDLADLVPTGAFVEAITVALGDADKTTRNEKLEAVLSTFGHVFPTRVVLGLSLCASSKLTYDAQVCLNSHFP